MHTQPDLFRQSCADVHVRQPDLYPAEDLSCALHCDQCGDYLVRTPSGFLCCPNGHGKLLEEQPSDEPSNEPSDAELFEEAAEVHRARGEFDTAAQYEQLAARARL